MSTQPKDFTVTRVFEAPIKSVWHAWSDTDHVMHWWGPTGFTSPTCRLDFREGGTTIAHMRAPADFGGQDFYNTWTYTSIVPIQQIEFIQNFADQDGKRIHPADAGLPAEIPEDVRNVVTFKALDDSRTEMTVTEYGYSSDQILEMSKMGLEQCLDKMTASFT